MKKTGELENFTKEEENWKRFFVPGHKESKTFKKTHTPWNRGLRQPKKGDKLHQNPDSEKLHQVSLKRTVQQRRTRGLTAFEHARKRQRFSSEDDSEDHAFEPLRDKKMAPNKILVSQAKEVMESTRSKTTVQGPSRSTIKSQNTTSTQWNTVRKTHKNMTTLIAALKEENFYTGKNFFTEKIKEARVLVQNIPNNHHTITTDFLRTYLSEKITDPGERSWFSAGQLGKIVNVYQSSSQKTKTRTLRWAESVDLKVMFRKTSVPEENLKYLVNGPIGPKAAAERFKALALYIFLFSKFTDGTRTKDDEPSLELITFVKKLTEWSTVLNIFSNNMPKHRQQIENFFFFDLVYAMFIWYQENQLMLTSWKEQKIKLGLTTPPKAFVKVNLIYLLSVMNVCMPPVRVDMVQTKPTGGEIRSK